MRCGEEGGVNARAIDIDCVRYSGLAGKHDGHTFPNPLVLHRYCTAAALPGRSRLLQHGVP